MLSAPLRLMVSVGLQEAASTEARDDAARLLRRELADAGVGEVALARAGDVPPGVKSAENFLFGALVLSVLPGALTTLLAVSRDWASRRAGRTLTFSYGDGDQRFEFQYDPAQTDLNQLVTQLLQAQTAANQLTLGAGSQVGGDVVGGDKVSHSTVGGDSVGRDKITHIHAAPGATVILGSRPVDEAPANPPPDHAAPTAA